LCAINGELAIGVEDQLLYVILFLSIVDWYTPIKEYFHKGYFEIDVAWEEQKCFTIKSRPYTFYGENLYKLGPDGILRQCLSPAKAHVILTKLHEGSTREHYGISIIVKKILIASYQWPTIQCDVVELCQSYAIIYQWLTPMYKSGKGPLQLVLAFEPFMKWGLDYMGPIKTSSCYTRN
jgi:hypothetical protein